MHRKRQILRILVAMVQFLEISSQWRFRAQAPSEIAFWRFREGKDTHGHTVPAQQSTCSIQFLAAFPEQIARWTLSKSIIRCSISCWSMRNIANQLRGHG